MNLDVRISLAEIEIVKILYLKQIVDEILDGFNDVPWVTRIIINEVQNKIAQIAIPLTNIPQVETSTIKWICRLDKQLQKKKAIICGDFDIIFVEVPINPMAIYPCILYLHFMQQKKLKLKSIKLS